MKRLVTLAALIILFASCAAAGKPLARGAVLGGGETAIAARIVPEFEVEATSVSYDPAKLGCSLVFCRDKEKAPTRIGGAGDVCREVAFAEDFIVALPAGRWYLRGVVIRLTNRELMVLTPAVEIAPGPDDRFLYLGDIVFFMQDDRVRARVDDRSVDVLPRCAAYLTDGTGKPVVPRVKLAEPEPRVRLRVFRSGLYGSQRLMMER